MPMAMFLPSFAPAMSKTALSKAPWISRRQRFTQSYPFPSPIA